MENETTKKNKVANLIEKIDKKKSELKQMKKDLQKAFNDISIMWKDESAKQFPQLNPCNIGEYVGVDITIKDKVYNIFISEYSQKLYCMFCLDRKDKNNSSLPLKKAMDQADIDKLSAVVNNYLNQNDEKVCSTGEGYFVRFEKGQYDDAFQFYLDMVRTFVERLGNNKSNICFKPWVGDNYFSTGYKGKRILVLGESHYCTSELSENGRCYPICRKINMQEDCFSQTQSIVEKFVYEYDGEGPLQTYLSFERALTGKALTQKEREALWHSIVFYNYIQYSQSGPREPLVVEDWDTCEAAFKEILERYLPDYVIAWGKQKLWECLPNWNGTPSKIFIENGDSTEVWTYSIKGKQIPVLQVYHPSIGKGKQWLYWHEFYRQFLGI